MSLKQFLGQALAARPPFAAGRDRLEVADGPERLRLELMALDSLACAFRELVLESDRLANASLAELEAVSRRLAERVNYLLEPIRPIEADVDECVVQLRSLPPDQSDDGTSYFELLARRGALSLVRYRQPAGAPREVSPAQVTREVLLRLVDDLVGAI